MRFNISQRTDGKQKFVLAMLLKIDIARKLFPAKRTAVAVIQRTLEAFCAKRLSMRSVIISESRPDGSSEAAHQLPAPATRLPSGEGAVVMDESRPGQRGRECHIGQRSARSCQAR